jgi:hypothetical protein
MSYDLTSDTKQTSNDEKSTYERGVYDSFTLLYFDVAKKTTRHVFTRIVLYHAS